MDMDELDNGMRVRHTGSGKTGTITQVVDVVMLAMDDGGGEFEVFPGAGEPGGETAGDLVVAPEDLEPIEERWER